MVNRVSTFNDWWLVNINSDDEDDVISDGWIDTVRASMDKERLSHHYQQPPINGQRPSSGDLKPRPITIKVRVLTTAQYYYK